MARKGGRHGGGGTNKWRIVMGEFKRGTLHSGSKRGPVVTNAAQARAIAASEQRHYNRGGYH